ncbi:MAG TPA: signal recognition particle protein [Myxococcota bacterium]|nr:signal recognition particle protein [Myxococcota bacterium]
MFDVLSRGFESAMHKVRGQTRLTEENLAPALREVRASLLQADVQLDVIKDFLERVKADCLGEVVQLRDLTGKLRTLGPEDHFIKACYDQMVELMTSPDQALVLDGSPAVIMMVGLQGSGKTTTTGKLAKKLMREGHRPLLVAADVYRPAAIDQLLVLGRKLAAPVFSIKGMKPVDLARAAVAQARGTRRDVVIIDTAGRLAVDDVLMRELEEIRDAVKPQEILFVADAMIGQDAVRTAAEFHRRLGFTGFVLTKLDGDARGGAALSIKAVTGKPVKLLGQGEELDRLEDFRPEGLAQRILGFGDVVGLMQDFERHMDKDEAERGAQRILDGSFSYEDFVGQMRMLRRMGPIRDLLAKLPGVSGMMKDIPPEALDEREMDRTLAIIQSMTNQERRFPDILDVSRFRRIAAGSGRTFSDVRELHDRFLQARQMVQQMGKMMMGGGMPGMGGMPGLTGPAGQETVERPRMSAADRMEKKKKRKEAERARNRNRGR